MKCTLLIAAMTALGLTAGAQGMATAPKQKNFFTSVNIMYGFPAAGQILSGWGTPYSGTQNITSTYASYDFKKASLASGLYAKLGLGYFFGGHVGIGLDVNIGLANTKYTYTENSTATASAYNEEYVHYAKMPVILSPSLMVRSGGTNFNLIASGGLALPVSAKTIQEYTSTDATGTEFQKIETKNRMSLGFTGSLKGVYHLSKHMSINAGISGMMMTVSAKETELTEYTVNGRDVLPFLGADEKMIKHEKEGTYGTSNVVPAFDSPFSNVGLEAGITFWF